MCFSSVEILSKIVNIPNILLYNSIMSDLKVMGVTCYGKINSASAPDCHVTVTVISARFVPAHVP